MQMDNILIPSISQGSSISESNKTWLIGDNHLVPLDDDIIAVVQAAYLNLQTPRFQHLIFSWQYGSELHTLVGKDESYVLSESRRMIIDALSIDDRISDIRDFNYVDGVLSFKLITIYGDADMTMEVSR